MASTLGKLVAIATRTEKKVDNVIDQGTNLSQAFNNESASPMLSTVRIRATRAVRPRGAGQPVPGGGALL